MNGRERGPRVLHGPTGTERTAPSVRDPRGRGGGVHEGTTSKRFSLFFPRVIRHTSPGNLVRFCMSSRDPGRGVG
jgi:hypothetical protein